MMKNPQLHNITFDIEDISHTSILIVDDFSNKAQVLENILINEGFEVTIIADDQDIFSVSDIKQPDLIILDFLASGLNNHKIYHHIRKFQLKNLPVMFIVAETEEEQQNKIFEMGGSDYITTPFKKNETLIRIKNQLRIKKLIKSYKKSHQSLEEFIEKQTEVIVRADRYANVSLLTEGIVHNLRNPLATISGNIQLVQLQKGLIEIFVDEHPELKESSLQKRLNSIFRYSQAIETASLRLIKLIDYLVVKTQSDQNEFIERADLNKIISQEIEFLNANLQFKNQTQKEISLNEQPFWVEVIPAQIAQVLRHLVQNALDAIYDQDAIIAIKTGIDEDKKLAWFSVADNGGGISEIHLSQIYTPYFTTKSTETPSADHLTGTGLGLYICSIIIKAFQGNIECKSQPGVGSTFTVFLPLSQKKEKTLFEKESVLSE